MKTTWGRLEWVLLSLTLVLITAALLAGCSTANTVTEGDRQLSHQSREAAFAILAAASVNPANIAMIMTTASVIEANARQQLANWGAPKDPKPYSPEASAQSREQAKKEHETPWWQIALGGAIALLTGWAGRGGVGRLLLGVAPKLAAGPIGGGLIALVEGIVKAREEIRSRPPDKQTIGEADLLGILSKVQEAAGVKDYIKDLSHRIEEKVAKHL